MKPPERIYLQVEDEAGNKLRIGKDEVTWCRDRIHDSDIEYVLAAKAAKQGPDCLPETPDPR